jgi:hypothetical protein
MFGLRGLAEWTFADLAVVLSQTIVLYLLAGLVLPEFFGAPEVDLRAHYFKHRTLFFGGVIVLVATSLAKDLVIVGHLSAPPNVAFHLAFAVGAAAAMLTTRDWYHRLLAPAALAVFLAYVAALFARLA